MNWLDPNKKGKTLKIVPVGSLLTHSSTASSSTCLCMTPIPYEGTHTFTAKYSAKDKWEAFIGVAGEDIELN